MTETPAEAVQPLDQPPTTRQAVYDEAELRFVDAVPGESADETAKRLNGDPKGKVGRADGKRGRRYVVRDV